MKNDASQDPIRLLHRLSSPFRAISICTLAGCISFIASSCSTKTKTSTTAASETSASSSANVPAFADPSLEINQMPEWMTVVSDVEPIERRVPIIPAASGTAASHSQSRRSRSRSQGSASSSAISNMPAAPGFGEEVTVNTLVWRSARYRPENRKKITRRVYTSSADKGASSIATVPTPFPAMPVPAIPVPTIPTPEPMMPVIVANAGHSDHSGYSNHGEHASYHGGRAFETSGSSYTSEFSPANTLIIEDDGMVHSGSNPDMVVYHENKYPAHSTMSGYGQSHSYESHSGTQFGNHEPDIILHGDAFSASQPIPVPAPVIIEQPSSAHHTSHGGATSGHGSASSFAHETGDDGSSHHSGAHSSMDHGTNFDGPNWIEVGSTASSPAPASGTSFEATVNDGAYASSAQPTTVEGFQVVQTLPIESGSSSASSATLATIESTPSEVAASPSTGELRIIETIPLESSSSATTDAPPLDIFGTVNPAPAPAPVPPRTIAPPAPPPIASAPPIVRPTRPSPTAQAPSSTARPLNPPVAANQNQIKKFDSLDQLWEFRELEERRQQLEKEIEDVTKLIAGHEAKGKLEMTQLLTIMKQEKSDEYDKVMAQRTSTFGINTKNKVIVKPADLAAYEILP